MTNWSNFDAICLLHRSNLTPLCPLKSGPKGGGDSRDIVDVVGEGHVQRKVLFCDVINGKSSRSKDMVEDFPLMTL
jgi:hypothetical protein